MFYGIGLFLLGAASLALAFFGRDLTQLLRSPLKAIAESLGQAGGKSGTPFVPDPPPPGAGPPEAPAALPPRYPLTPQMRVFFGVIGLPLFLLGLARMTLDVLPDEGGDDGDITGTTSLTTVTTSVDTTGPAAACPPVPAGTFRVGERFRRPDMAGPSFQVVDPRTGGDPDLLWIDPAGLPVINPRFPLGAEAVAAAEAFGSPQAAIDYNRCHLRPEG